MNNADLLVSLLKAAGIRRGFGIPSGNVLPLMEAMRTGGIDFILTAHEGSAGFAADVTARVTGVPGLCIATLGPGATNLATGVGCAYLDRSPMIAITCTLNEPLLGRRIQMWIDHETLFRPITKASFTLRRGQIVQTVSEALRIALEEPQGPVHLDLPEDVAVAAADEAADEAADSLPVIRPTDASVGRMSEANPPQIERAIEILRRAKHPLAVIGSTAMRMRDPSALRAFIERHRIPFATTTMAKVLIDETHPLSIGCIERACRQIQRRFIREEVDLVIGLGYDTIEVEYEAWVGSVPVLHVDIERADVDGSVKIEHEVVGDLDASVKTLAAVSASENAWKETDVAEHRERFQAALRPSASGLLRQGSPRNDTTSSSRAREGVATPWRTEALQPHEAIDIVRRVLPREGVLAFDVGAHTHQIASQWTAYAPRTFLITNGWSSMGFGLPAAIAAKLANRHLPVVCVLGDGCFQMTCGEVAVAKRERLPIPIVVLDDRWLSLIKVKQERRALEHYGTAVFEEDVPPTPAHYFGVRAVGVRSADALERELTKALRGDEPVVIEARVDPTHYSETVYD